MSMCSKALNKNCLTMPGSVVDKRGSGSDLKEDAYEQNIHSRKAVKKDITEQPTPGSTRQHCLRELRGHEGTSLPVFRAVEGW